MILTKVFDYTAEAADGNYERIDLGDLSLLWIHRIGPGIGASVVEIARAFRDRRPGKAGSYTGGNMPYTFVNTPDQLQQALPLDEKGAHARRWGNMHGIGFAQLGDFNKQPPDVEQWQRAVDLCAELVPWLSEHSQRMFDKLPTYLRHELPVVGHGEVPGAYGTNSGKEQPNGAAACPGKYWSMDEFRQDVAAVMKQRAGMRLTDLGVRFTI